MGKGEREGGKEMTETYDENAPIEIKTMEELQCIRCALERPLKYLSSQEFLDYQMEKFSKYISWMDEEHD